METVGISGRSVSHVLVDACDNLKGPARLVILETVRHTCYIGNCCFLEQLFRHAVVETFSILGRTVILFVGWLLNVPAILNIEIVISLGG